MIVTLDSNIFIWGLQVVGMRRGNPRQKDLGELQKRARILFDQLKPEDVVVSVVTLAEILIGVEEPLRDNFSRLIQKKYLCVPFDVQAAALAANLWTEQRKHINEPPASRTCIKADVQIVASVKKAGAKVLYSHDQRLRRIAELAELEVRELPTHHDGDLFFEDEPQ